MYVSLSGRVFHNIKGKAAKHASSFCSGAKCFIHGVIHVTEETGVTSDSIEFLYWHRSLLDEVELAFRSF
jgi:hypothetical protein